MTDAHDISGKVIQGYKIDKAIGFFFTILFFSKIILFKSKDKENFQLSTELKHKTM